MIRWAKNPESPWLIELVKMNRRDYYQQKVRNQHQVLIGDYPKFEQRLFRTLLGYPYRTRKPISLFDKGEYHKVWRIKNRVMFLTYANFRYYHLSRNIPYHFKKGEFKNRFESGEFKEFLPVRNPKMRLFKTQPQWNKNKISIKTYHNFMNWSKRHTPDRPKLHRYEWVKGYLKGEYDRFLPKELRPKNHDHKLRRKYL